MRLDDAVLAVAAGHRSVAGCTRWLLPEARHLCLLPALRFHDLTPVAPFEIWFAIPNKAWHPARRP